MKNNVASTIFCTGSEEYAEIIITGILDQQKDEVMSLGYVWTKIRVELRDFLSTSPDNMAWIKRISLETLISDKEKIVDELKQLGTSPSWLITRCP